MVPHIVGDKKGWRVINCNSLTISFNTVLYCRIINCLTQIKLCQICLNPLPSQENLLKCTKMSDILLHPSPLVCSMTLTVKWIFPFQFQMWEPQQITWQILFMFKSFNARQDLYLWQLSDSCVHIWWLLWGTGLSSKLHYDR